jgi:hypothetical protein
MLCIGNTEEQILWAKMEFLKGIFFEVSGHKLEFSQTQVFVWFSTLIFLFYKMTFIKRLEFSYFPDFFVRNFKPKKSIASLKSASRRDSE